MAETGGVTGAWARLRTHFRSLLSLPLPRTVAAFLFSSFCRVHRRSVARLLLLAIASVEAAVASSPDQISPEHRKFFEEKIRPVLVDHCYSCHSAESEKLKGGLMLDSRAAWEKGGDSGVAVVVPGDPDASLLIQAIRHDDEDLVMPPKKPKLPAAVIADLTAWVKLGAPDPRTGTVDLKRADKETWWSLQPLASPAVPEPPGIPAAWSVSWIDRFVFARLAEKQLQPNPPADARTLIRRLSYDVCGLPPTIEDVEAFVEAVAVDRTRAVERWVDRLLASPGYGEHWGRHWLDVVRFGESVGFERNGLINTAWPFRDYIIRSLNDDKPFNRLIIEHLAGDVIGRDDPEVEVGTTFLVAGPYDNVGNQDPVAKANIRAGTLDDLINATSSAFLGLTVSCARCHHHKFDPIPTEDYYRLRAAFEGVEHGEREFSTPEERERFQATLAPLRTRRSEKAARLDALTKDILARASTAVEPENLLPAPAADLTEHAFSPVLARYVKFRILGRLSSPDSGVGAALDEFELWTTGPNPRNVALASAGTLAEGTENRRADDFAGAYGVQLATDGKFGARWQAGNPAELKLTLAAPEEIDRMVYSWIRGSAVENMRDTGGLVAEYELLTSLDGKEWRTAATSLERKPSSEKHAVARRLRAASPEDRAQRAALAAELAAGDAEIRAVPPLPKVWAGVFRPVEEPTRVHRGGDPMKPGNVVVPSSLAVLDSVMPSYELPVDAPENQRRLALAEWIASDSNPLTARVLANRVWHYHFGAGLVDTPGDLGYLGSRPTHPELLDALARRLQAHGWRLKPLHREILLSQTYQQSGARREDAARIDADARLLWRFPPRRLQAEEIRDTLLSVSGKLNGRMGGPGFRLYRYAEDNVSTYFPLDRPGPETYRRAVYHQNARASVVDYLSDFDLPDNAFPAPSRSRTTSPLQALTLLNHRFTLDLAEALAERMAGTDDAAVRRAFRWTLQRDPTTDELDAARGLISAHGARAFCRGMFNTNELLRIE